MNARDELAEIIGEQLDHPAGPNCPACADAQRAAAAVEVMGYRKPRTITTAEELDALAEGTLISTPSRNPHYPSVFRKAWADGWLALDPSDRDDGENTITATALLRWYSHDSTATILYSPGVTA